MTLFGGFDSDSEDSGDEFLVDDNTTNNKTKNSSSANTPDVEEVTDKTKGDSKANIDSKEESDPDTKTKKTPNEDAEPDAEVDADTDTDLGSDAGTDAGTDADTDAGTDAGTDADTEDEEDVDNDIDAEDQAEDQDNIEPKNEDEDKASKKDVLFSEAPAENNSTSFEKLYKLESRDKLVSELEKSNNVTKIIKILIVGVTAEYIKFDTKSDKYGFTMSKDQQERDALFQTAVCKASVQHVNVPSLHSKVKVDETNVKRIFDEAVRLDDAVSILQKLKSENLVPSEGDSSAQNTMVFVSPFTPFADILFTEKEEGKGHIAILVGNSIDTTFDFIYCLSLRLNNMAPKKVYLSSILSTLAASGAENIIVVNLALGTEDSKSNMTSIMGSEDDIKEEVMEPQAEGEEGQEEEDEGEEGQEKEEEDEGQEKEEEDEGEGEKEEEEEGLETTPEVSEKAETDEEQEEEDEDTNNNPPIKVDTEDMPLTDVEEVKAEEATPVKGGKKTKKKMNLKLKSFFKKTRNQRSRK
jgi:hypothetical protein